MKAKALAALIAALVFMASCGTNPAPSGAAANKSGALASTTGQKPPQLSSTVSSTQAEKEERVIIKEKMFVAQTNDVYINTDLYLGKEFQYEGIFTRYDDTFSGNTYYSVIRYGPGCCGYDNNCGFEVEWADASKAYPEENDWVEAIGKLEEYTEDGTPYLRLRLSSLKILPTRGLENVTQ